MNKTFTMTVAALIGIAGQITPGLAQDVGVSISIGQPGFYGRIELGDTRRPRVIYAEPVIVERVTVVQEPIYLHVRPGHARRWREHCREYAACGQRVYFVNDDWYNTVYVQQYRERGGHYEDHHDDHDDDDCGHVDAPVGR